MCVCVCVCARIAGSVVSICFRFDHSNCEPKCDSVN